MNDLFFNELVKYAFFFDFSLLKNKTILITGSTGNVGSIIVKFLLVLNKYCSMGIKIVCIVRNSQKAKMIFGDDINSLILIETDILNKIQYNETVDYIIHGANITNSKFYTEKPVDTIITMIDGTKNILDLAVEKNIKSFVYLSSMEVYGSLESDNLEENTYGVIDFLLPRSSYSEGKRMAESLCHAYFTQYNIPCKCARLSQLIGVGLDIYDSRFPSYLIRSILKNRDIILNTDGMSCRNSIYTLDAVTGIFFILLKGVSGESYNVAASDSALTIKDTVLLVANSLESEIKLRFDIRQNCFAPSTHVNLSNKKLTALGWSEKTSYIDSYIKMYEFTKENVLKGDNQKL